MEPLCHRCSATLAAAETFCPNCGAPQLRLEESADESQPRDPGNTVPGVDPGGISWKKAVGAAISVAVPVGLLSSQVFPPLSGACCLWGIGGSIGAVGLYRRRSTPVPLEATTGLRIGLVVGLLASFCSSAANGAWLLVQRFLLHQGVGMDKNWQTQMEQASQATSQLFPQLPQQASQVSMHFWLTPDGRAAGVLLNAVLFSAGMLLFSTIGGALGARIFAARNRPLKNS